MIERDQLALHVALQHYSDAQATDNEQLFSEALDLVEWVTEKIAEVAALRARIDVLEGRAPASPGPEPTEPSPSDPKPRTRSKMSADERREWEAARRRAQRAAKSSATNGATNQCDNGATSSATFGATSVRQNLSRARFPEREEKRKLSDSGQFSAEIESSEKGEASSQNARGSATFGATSSATERCDNGATRVAQSPLPRDVSIGPAGELAQVWNAVTAQPVAASEFAALVPQVKAAAEQQKVAPLDLWKRAVKSFVDDCAGRGKRPNLRWLLSQPEWLAPPIKEAPPPSRYVNREADAQMYRDLAEDRRRMLKGVANG